MTIGRTDGRNGKGIWQNGGKDINVRKEIFNIMYIIQQKSDVPVTEEKYYLL